MADRLRSNLPTERLQVSVGDFETIDLAAESADAVFSASAYHWISPAAQLDRPAADPAPGRRPRDRRTLPGRLARGSRVLRRGAADLRAVRARARGSAGAGAAGRRTRRSRRHSPGILASLTSTVHRWDWDQTYTAAEYRKLMLSFSDTNMMDAERPRRPGGRHGGVHQQPFQRTCHEAAGVTLTTARRQGRARAGGAVDQAGATASGATGSTSPVGWTRKIQTSQVTWLTTSAPSGTPAA